MRPGRPADHSPPSRPHRSCNGITLPLPFYVRVWNPVGARFLAPFQTGPEALVQMIPGLLFGGKAAGSWS